MNAAAAPAGSRIESISSSERIASDRFDDGVHFNLEPLRFRGRLWVVLGATEDYIASGYRRLWPGYTPDEERADREQIDELLALSESDIL